MGGGASVEGNNGHRNRDPKDEFYISPQQTQTALIIYSIKAHILRDTHVCCLVIFQREPKICLRKNSIQTEAFFSFRLRPAQTQRQYGLERLRGGVSQTVRQFFSSSMIHMIPSLKHVTMTLKVKCVTFGDF